MPMMETITRARNYGIGTSCRLVVHGGRGMDVGGSGFGTRDTFGFAYSFGKKSPTPHLTDVSATQLCRGNASWQ